MCDYLVIWKYRYGTILFSVHLFKCILWFDEQPYPTVCAPWTLIKSTISVYLHFQDHLGSVHSFICLCSCIPDDLSLSLESQTYQPNCSLDHLEVPQLYPTHCSQNEPPKFLYGAPKFGHWYHYSINNCNTDLVVHLSFGTFWLKKKKQNLNLTYTYLAVI